MQPKIVNIATIEIPLSNDITNQDAQLTTRALLQWVHHKGYHGILTCDGKNITQDNYRKPYVTLAKAIDLVGYLYNTTQAWDIDWL